MSKRDLIIIIGAGSGLGKDCCQYLSNKYNVIGIFNKNKPSTKKFKSAKVDLNKKNQIENFFKVFRDDIINSRSVHFFNFANFQKNNLLYKITDVEIKKAYGTNVFSNIYFTSKLIPLILNKNSSITFVSSSFGMRGDKGISLYSSTKHSLVGLMKSIVSEYSKFKIRCNILSLGFFDSLLWRDLSEKLKQERLGRVPDKSMGKKKDLFSALNFIITTNYYNGTILELDGGYGSF